MKRLYSFDGLWLALVVLGWAELPVGAANLYVDSLDDGGKGSLRRAIFSARSGDTIGFLVNGRITLTTGELAIGKHLTIAGPGMKLLAIDGNGASRVFNILSNTTATISGLTITNGLDVGILDGTEENEAGAAGGVLNDGNLTLVDCSISGNKAQGAGGGGYWINFAGTAYGGGLLNNGSLNLENCSITGNVAIGGWIDQQWNYRLAGAARGGGIANHGTLSLSRCTVSGNAANGGSSAYICGAGIGGGILNTGILSLTRCTIDNNSANGGSLWQQFGPYAGGRGAGGGIANEGTLNLNTCTLVVNRAWAGMSVVNGTGPPADGGGIWNSETGGVARVLSCTISSNDCRGMLGQFPGDSNGGGISTAIGGFSASVTIENSIVSGNHAWDECDCGTAHGMDVMGPVISGGFNLVGDTYSSSGWAGTDVRTLSPGLGPLQDNGGPTRTMALLPSSPAIDQGYSPGWPIDQRGFPRPVDFSSYRNAAGGDGSDIGAYEVQPILDIGFCGFDGIKTNKFACELPGIGGVYSSPFRITRNGTNYGVLLVPTNSPDASKFRIQTASGTKSLMKLLP